MKYLHLVWRNLLRRKIRTIFTVQGLVVAGVGTSLGLLLGIGLIGLVQAVDYELEAAIYLIDRLPVEVDAAEWLLVAGATLLCTLVATQYSSSRAAAKSPVEGIRAVE